MNAEKAFDGYQSGISRNENLQTLALGRKLWKMENASSRKIIKTRNRLFGFNQNSTTRGIKNESPTSVACKLFSLISTRVK
jgi:hypothetical protein